MKRVLSLAYVLLAISPAIAGLAPVPINGVLPGSPPHNPAALRIREDSDHRDHREDREDHDDHTGHNGCKADNVHHALRHPTRSAGARAFCSTYLQSTSTVTTTSTIPQTMVITATSTQTATTTKTDTASYTATTLLCPATPTTPPTCGYPAYGFQNYLISSTPNVDSATCEQNCLKNPNCKSYQTQSGGQSYCNLFNAPTMGNTQYEQDSAFFFYDRNCPDNRPAGCASSPPSMVKRRVAIPNHLAGVAAKHISSACSCLITSPAAPAMATATVSTTSTTTTTSTVAVTATDARTVTTTATVTAYVTAAP